MSFLELAKKRFSVRKFKTDIVKNEDLQYILEAGRIAPSANNSQPWQFVVTQGDAKNDEVNNLYHREWFNDAPIVIVIVADHSKSWYRSDGKDHADIDAAIAADHMTLAATEKGLGTCWVCNFDIQKTKEYFRLPEHLEPMAFLPLGYPDAEVNENRHLIKRKPLNEIVIYK